MVPKLFAVPGGPCLYPTALSSALRTMLGGVNRVHRGVLGRSDDGAERM